MYQESGMHHSLLAAKAWLAKKGLTVPRLELISAHMAANIVDNVRRALEEYVVWFVYGWKDSTVVSAMTGVFSYGGRRPSQNVYLV